MKATYLKVISLCDQGCFGHPFNLEPFDFEEDLRSLRLLPLPTLKVKREPEGDADHDERVVQQDSDTNYSYTVETIHKWDMEMAII